MNEADQFSLSVIEEVQKAIQESGMSNAEVIKRAKISQDYFYTRTRGEKPFNTNDISRIAEVLGIDPLMILRRASAVIENDGLTVDPSALSEDERKRLALSGTYDLAANENPDKRYESGMDGQ
ncbi:hypothetical protein [Bifidobacterium crudilactis]|uniref:hypothetical protein n=1 Tax=Bifidobacterium crudilactis TaxID=327277 RepID=UPI00235254B1|nr:hypothetical protein [Bifidobacterium crudilactis]MCI2149329.1 hypothetical protein [Bifidobacterium crudilactis]MCI2158515.1 hypothetical protein [Bifidobacterium crudilactis]